MAVAEEIKKQQLNVKEIEYRESHANTKDISVDLDTILTLKLEAEGYARELSRQIQAFRKELGLNKKDKVETYIITDGDFKKILESQKKFIRERTNSKTLEVTTNDKERFKNSTDFKVKDKRGKIAILAK